MTPGQFSRQRLDNLRISEHLREANHVEQIRSAESVAEFLKQLRREARNHMSSVVRSLLRGR